MNVSEQSRPQIGWCERLYEAKAAELVLYGRALGLSHSEAEDVVQETFTVLMRRCQPPEEPARYAMRAFRNRALNYRRGVWRRLTRELESACWFERQEGETAVERAAMRCLAELPAEQREVIVLKIWHGYTFEAMADLLEVSPNTLAGRYRYGLRKLKACLRKKDYEQLESLGEGIAILETAPPVREA